ncbi:tRNA (adenosine(37)-N6)-threonylcarbamoyltransferase complex ATPase subunit type 1 TsaE, partial [Candidatus Acetothermia bacterium]
MERVVITEGPEETVALGVELARGLQEGDVVALAG